MKQGLHMEIDPEWEPVPWNADAETAARQRSGFLERAARPVRWQPIAFDATALTNFYDLSREELLGIDAVCHAPVGGEAWLLVDSLWFGWPDPPRWGLIVRPPQGAGAGWQCLGRFSKLPAPWQVPAART